MSDFAVRVTGWMFIGAAAMLWMGWTLLPVRIGPFFKPEDFKRVLARLWLWIWLFRVHLFGHLAAVMAFAALGTLAGKSESGVLVWPAVAVLVVGLSVAALAGAFYYHFGAWGAVDLKGQSAEKIQAFVGSLQVSTEYVTCLVRFGRVFFGLGQAALAVGLFHWGILPFWLSGAPAFLGLAAIAVTMAFPDNLEYYGPLFHLNSAWLAGTGVALLAWGIP